MARRVALLPLALLASLTGCLGPETERSTSAWLPRPASQPDLGKDTVILDIALIERGLGDPFLNGELWQHTDQLVMDLDKKSALEANGLRVGQLVGLTPAELHNLLKSERACLNPRRRLLPAGQRDTHYLGPVQPQCQFDMHLGGAPVDVVVDQGRFCLDTTATPTPDGRMKLAFVPKVETGEQVLPFQPAPDQSNWVYRVERPARRYPELAWEVALHPNEFIIVGPHLGKKNSFGYRALVQEEGLIKMQRLLVIRTSRPGASGDGEPTLEDIARATTNPPLAVQATLGAIRASRP